MFLVSQYLPPRYLGSRSRIWNLVMSTSNNKKRQALDNILLKNKIQCTNKSQNADNIVNRLNFGGGSILTDSTVTIPNLVDKISTTTAPTMSSNPEVEILDVPDKSMTDKKSYRIVKLLNGLTAMLISDPMPLGEKKEIVESESDTSSSSESESDDEHSVGSEAGGDESSKQTKEKLAACSLCVDVGSFSDPRDIQGLAHFLEHMIFMGSEKYPNENEFDSFVKKCGGFDNADTDFEETSFYFEISEHCLDEAFDRFASLFRVPLMRKEAMTREREAVHSEFLSKKQGDDVRKEQLMQSLILDKHPGSIFAWGNLTTLKDNITEDNLFMRVHEFRKRHYSAHRMYMCMQARLPLDTMQELLVKHFSSIPNNQLPGLDFSVESQNWDQIFKPDFTKKIFVVKPVANVSKVDLTFCLPPLVKEYKAKPHHFVAYLLGHEGEGSLCSYLRRKLWAMEVIAGIDESGFGMNSLFSLFTVSIFLTQEGFRHLGEIIGTIFSYLRFLKIVGPKESIFRELQNIESTSFRFQTERNALDNVSGLVTNLKWFPPKHTLSGPCLYFDYDPAGINLILEHLNNSIMNIMITSKEKFNNHDFNQIEPWFGTEYCAIDCPMDWFEMWKTATPNGEFKVPPPNPFIATNFNVLCDQSSVVPKFPEKIIDNDLCELWFKQDNRFLFPIAHYHFYFMSPVTRLRKENTIIMTLYSLLLKFKLVEQLYPASVAGLEYACFPSEKGLVMKVSGYNENLDRIVDVFAKNLIHFAENITENEFNMFIEQQLRNYYNTIIRPKSFAKTLRLALVDSHFIPTHHKYEIIKHIKLNEFKEFARQFVKEMRIVSLMQGNLDANKAHQIMDNVLHSLQCRPVQFPEIFELRANQIPLGNTYVRVKSMNQHDVNTVTCSHYQIGPISIKLNCLIDLLMIICEEPLFDILRSQEQLGYDVSCSIRDNYGLLGYTITINSQEDNHSAEYIDERIEAFRSGRIEKMRKMSNEDFEQFKNALIKIKLTDDNDLKDEMCRNWSEITTEEYLFDRFEKEVSVLQSITQQEFLDFYNTIYYDNHRKLTVQVIGNPEATQKSPPPGETDMFRESFTNLEYVGLRQPNAGRIVNDIDTFKKTLTTMPVIKTGTFCLTMDNEVIS